eukprot:gene16781-biopygen5290
MEHFFNHFGCKTAICWPYWNGKSPRVLGGLPPWSPPPSPVSAAPHPCGATAWVRGAWVRGAVGAAGSPPLGRTSSGGAVYWNGKCPLGAAYWNEMAP